MAKAGWQRLKEKLNSKEALTVRATRPISSLGYVKQLFKFFHVTLTQRRYGHRYRHLLTNSTEGELCPHETKSRGRMMDVGCRMKKAISYKLSAISQTMPFGGGTSYAVRCTHHIKKVSRWFKQHGKKLVVGVVMTDGGTTSISKFKRWFKQHGRKLATASVAVIVALAMAMAVGFQNQFRLGQQLVHFT